MNKNDVINELVNKLGFDEEKCTLINKVVEENFIVGEKNKDAMVKQFIEKVGVSEEEAEKIYETVIGVVVKGFLNKMKNPFNKD